LRLRLQRKDSNCHFVSLRAAPELIARQVAAEFRPVHRVPDGDMMERLVCGDDPQFKSENRCGLGRYVARTHPVVPRRHRTTLGAKTMVLDAMRAALLSTDCALSIPFRRRAGRNLIYRSRLDTE
jgi:hypothetical protein